MTTSIEGYQGIPGFKPVVVQIQTANEPSSPANRPTVPVVETKAAETVDPRQVAEATRKVAELFQTVRRNLEFREDPSSGRMIVSVIDADSGELIRQIPPEQMVRMAEHLEQMQGLLLGERA